MYYYFHHWYDPSIGRFIGEDPLERAAFSLIGRKRTIFLGRSVVSPKELAEYHPLHKEDREPVLAEFLQETNPTETTFGINYLKIV